MMSNKNYLVKRDGLHMLVTEVIDGDEEVQEITPDLEHLLEFFRYIAEVANTHAQIEIDGIIRIGE